MKSHKDLPPGSQQWAKEVDDMRSELTSLREVVRRLTENAGIDMSNPKRGVNPPADTPSIKSPVGQKLSSLADVGSYNVLEGQVLSWSQQGQKWLPATLPSAGGTIDISAISYTGLAEGYGKIADPANYAYLAAGIKPDAYGNKRYIENWTTGTAYYGAGNWRNGPGVALIEQVGGDYPFIRMSVEHYPTSLVSYAVLNANKFYLQNAFFQVTAYTTANRPVADGNNDYGASIFDVTLGIPIWWNGTTWINALGTAV